jgi:hypothetical protein
MGMPAGGEAKLPQEARVWSEERSDESPSEGGVGGKRSVPLTRSAPALQQPSN